VGGFTDLEISRSEVPPSAVSQSESSRSVVAIIVGVIGAVMLVCVAGTSLRRRWRP
jgi:hypothetical protein